MTALPYCWIDGRQYGEDHREFIEILSAEGFSNFNMPDILDWAVRTGSVEDVRKLVEMGVNLCDSDSFPIGLQYAVEHCNLAVLKDLLVFHKLRDHINRANSEGCTLLDFAAKLPVRLAPSMIKILRENGANAVGSHTSGTKGNRKYAWRLTNGLYQKL